MFGIGSAELLVILVVALIALGPNSLATVSRSLGKAVGEFRRVSTEFQRTLNAEVDQQDLKEKKSARKTVASVPSENQNTSAGQVANFPHDSPIAKAIAKAKADGQKKSEEKENV